MKYYHVRISVEGSPHDEVKNNLDDETLERQILAPYRSGEPMTMNGKTLTWDQVERVRISTSDEPSSAIIDRLRVKDRNSSVAVIGGPSYEWRAASSAEDVTDQFITGPPGHMAPNVSGAVETLERASDAESHAVPERSVDSSAVFVVAGRDSKAVAAVVAFLRALRLQIVEWEHAIAKTGLPNPYVGDVVETGLRMAGAALVLLTPDDLVRLRSDLVRDDDGSDERDIRGQARPNVYYEAGIADALGRERTVIVEIGNVKSFSDAAGRHVVRYDGSPAKRQALAERLRLAGLDVNTTGQDWLHAGDVEPVLAAAAAAVAAGTTPASSTVDKAELTSQIGGVLERFEEVRQQAQHDDLSDLPDETLELIVRAQAVVDRFAADTSYAAEAARASDRAPHQRLPFLIAALRALRSDVA